VNGDTAAGAIAGALKADRLLLLTDVAGVKNASGEIMTQITPEEVRQMTADGTISGGMIPKTETALMALDQGVRAVTIMDGRIAECLLVGTLHRYGARASDPLDRAAGQAAHSVRTLADIAALAEPHRLGVFGAFT
jgi:acetylglutamate kinase